MRVGIVSGYFNPFHIGHLRMLEEAEKDCDKLCVIINNDKQQLLKKGKIIMEQMERALLVMNYKHLVDDCIISIDDDETVCESLRWYGEIYKDHDIVFYNGGDRKSRKSIPEDKVCEKYNIGMKFGIGGFNKANSSSKINKLRGLE